MCHPLPTGWSGTDEDAIRKTPMGSIPELVRWQVSLVHTTVDGWIARFDQFDKDIHWVIPVAVNGDFTEVEKQNYAEVQKALAKAKKPTQATWWQPFLSKEPPPLTDNEVLKLSDDWDWYPAIRKPAEPIEFDGEVFEPIGYCGACGSTIMACLDSGEVFCSECGAVFDEPLSIIGKGLCPLCTDELIMSDDGMTLHCSECENTYDGHVYRTFADEKPRPQT